MVHYTQKYLHKGEMALAVLLLAGIAGYSVYNAQGLLIFPDEYTYWSYAAEAAGYDWSSVTSLGAYYSYGYSLILIPVFLLCKNPTTAYRAAVGINFVLLLLALLYLVRFMRGKQEYEKMPIVLFSTAVVFYTGHLFSAQMTLTETLLFVLSVAIGALLYHYLESNSSLSLFMLMIMLNYIYVVHMRTVGIVLSALLILLCHMLSKQGKKGHLIIVIFCVVILFALNGLIKEWSYDTVFGGINRELVSGNDYIGQLKKIRYIFTLHGFYDTIVHIFGKLLYLGLSTFGIFAFGIYGLCRKILDEKEKTECREFGVWLLLSVMAQILIGTIYLLTLGESSDYTYGRYNELILPFVMMEGMRTIWLMHPRKMYKMTALIAALHLFATFFVVRQIYDTGADNFCGYFMPGICWIYDGGNFSAADFYREAYLFGTVMMVAVMLLFLWSRCGREKFLFLLAIMGLITAVKTDRIFLQPFKRAAYRDYQLAGEIENLCSRKEGAKLLFRYEDYPPYIGMLQFMMRDRKIEVTDQIREQDIEDDLILIFPFDDIEQEKWVEKFAYQDVYGHFSILFN